MTDLFRLAWRTCHMPKAGNTAAEYEDAFSGDPEQGRFAIADGASESAFAREWAQILVQTFVRTPGRWSTWLGPARERWCTQIQGRELPWHAEAKFEQGAYAAMLSIAFKGNHWSAKAIGDSCLFHVKADCLRRAFPLHRSEEFGNQPSLLASRSSGAANGGTRPEHEEGRLRPGDAIFLMTDALAQWFLKEVEEGRKPWKQLQGITEEHFVPLINTLRASNRLRNDDVTLVLIQPLDS